MPQLNHNQVFAKRYRLIEQIGAGDFAEVWKAADQMADDTEVAVKIFVPDTGLDDTGIRQFREEYAFAQYLNHSNLLKANYYDIMEGSPYLIMPLMEKGSLARMLYEQGPLNEEQLAVLLRQVADALAYLHSCTPPVMHQDIKPENILIDGDSIYRLTDFGISSQLRSTLRKSTASQQAVSMAYAPPEQFGRPPRNVCAGDVFSLGVIVYEAATGELPREGAGGSVLGDTEQIPLLPETFSPALVKMIASTMAIEPENRPSAEVLAGAAANYLETGRWEMQNIQKETEKLPDQSGNTAEHIHKKQEPAEGYTEQKPAKAKMKFLGTIKSRVVVPVIFIALALLGLLWWPAWQNNSSEEVTEQESSAIKNTEQKARNFSTGDDNTEKSEEQQARNVSKGDDSSEKAKEQQPRNVSNEGDDNTKKREEQKANGLSKEAKAWQKAQQSGELVDYRRYVNMFPDGNHVAEAKRFINDEKAWEKAQNSGKLEAYLEYVNTYPNGNHVAEAEENIRQIRKRLRPLMVKIEGGTFQMGSNAEEADNDEQPVHEVTVSDFYMGKYQVTHKRYIAFMNDLGVKKDGTYNGKAYVVLDEVDCAVGYRNGKFYFKGSAIADSGQSPMIYVTWYGADAYCEWLSKKIGETYRLPTDAEWEYAAGGGEKNRTKYAGTDNKNELVDYAWYNKNSKSKTRPVGKKKPNSLGLYDMSGNVWEWCRDWYDSDYYSNSPKNNPKGPEDGSNRILRGGSWFSGAEFCRVTSRINSSPGSSNINDGFRVVRVPE